MSGKLPVGLQAAAHEPTAPAAAAPAARKRSRFARLGLAPAAGVIGGVAADAQRSRLPQMAAALAYRTIFGLIPVLVVALVGLKMFTSDDDIERTLSQALRYAGLSEIVIDAEDAEIPPEALEKTWIIPFGPSAIPTLLVPLQPGEEDPPVANAGAADAPETPPGAITVETTGSERLDQWITQLVGRVSAIPFRAIGVIGLIALLYAAISMLVEIERAFNQIYRVPVGRSWVRRITNYWTLLTLGVIMLFATFYIGEQFKNWASSLAHSQGLVESNDAFSVGMMGFAVTVAISTTFLLFAYMVVPNTRVRLRPALAGAFIAALLWETGKWGFTQYLGFSTNYARLYGSVAILPLFLLWVYVTWLIVLVGLQISYYLQYEQYRKGPPPPAPAAPKPPAVVDPVVSVAVVAAVSRAFDEGRALTVAELARAVRAGEEAVRAILDRLIAHNIVHAVDHPPGAPPAPGGTPPPDAYTLSRPAEGISMAEVLESGYELVAPPPSPPGAGGDHPSTPADPIIDRLRKAQVDEVRGLTVAELVGHAPGLAAAMPGGLPAPHPRPDKAVVGPALDSGSQNGPRSNGSPGKSAGGVRSAAEGVSGDGRGGGAVGDPECPQPGARPTLPPAG